MSMQLRSHAEDIGGLQWAAGATRDSSSTSKRCPFPVSAATPTSPPPVHDSGLSVLIDLVPPTGTRTHHCTSETLKGSIRLTRPHLSSSADGAATPRPPLVALIKSLSVRFYCESRSLYWTLVDPTTIKTKSVVSSALDPPGSTVAEDQLRQTLQQSTLGTSKQLATEPSSTNKSKDGKVKNRSGARKKNLTGKKSSAADAECHWSLDHEWARAVFSEVSLVANGRLQNDIPVAAPILAPSRKGAAAPFGRAPTSPTIVDSVDELILPFRVALPLDVSYDEWNRCRGASRADHRVLRPAPPTCRDASDASVEWVCEAILDLRSSSFNSPFSSQPPTPVVAEFGLNSTDASSETGGTIKDAEGFPESDSSSFEEDILNPFVDSRGFLLSKSSRIVTRAVFPVVDADARLFKHDLSDEVVPSLATDERKKLRAHAGKRLELSEEKSRRAAWLKKIELRSKGLGSLIGTLSIEVVTHNPFYLSRTARRSPIGPLKSPLTPSSLIPEQNLRGSLNLFIGYEQSQTRSFFGGKTEPPTIKHVNLSVDAWSWTKGGNGKVRKEATPLRRLKVPLDLPLSTCLSTALDRTPSNSSAASSSTSSPPSSSRYKLRIPFDLRAPQADFPSIVDLVPSFKTANVEREYTISVSVRLGGGDTDYYIGVVPFQLTSGVAPLEVNQLGGIEEGEEEDEDDEVE